MRLTAPRFAPALALIIALSFASCSRRPAPVARTAPPPESVRVAESADRQFTSGSYAPAARDYERYLTLVPTGGKRDEALFRLGLIYALPGNTGQDWRRSANCLTQLLREFPASPLSPAARLILSLREETVTLTAETEKRDQRIRQLNGELEKLIKIDSERRKP